MRRKKSVGRKKERERERESERERDKETAAMRVKVSRDFLAGDKDMGSKR